MSEPTWRNPEPALCPECGKEGKLYTLNHGRTWVIYHGDIDPEKGPGGGYGCISPTDPRQRTKPP